MLLLAHIIIAVLSVLQATHALFVPTRTKMHATYGLVAATLVSGAVLVWQLHVPLVQPCLSGLAYTSALTALLAGANHRLHLASRAAHTTGWSRYLND